MRFDRVNLENSNFFIFFQVCPFIVADFNTKKCRICDNIFKVCTLVRRFLTGFPKLKSCWKGERWISKTLYINLLFDRICHEKTWKIRIFFIFFQVCPFIVANLNKYRISDNILKVCALVKRLHHHLIKSDKN